MEFINYQSDIIRVQSIIRGYLIRKRLIRNKDNMTLDKVIKYLRIFNNYTSEINNLNSLLTRKKIRNPNFPSEISENIVKFAILRKYNVLGNWDVNGDLLVYNKKIEVKGFMSDGPCSFGPTESWDWLYFVDCKRYSDFEFIVYEVKLSNTSELWRNLIISGKEFNISDIPEIPDNLDKLSGLELRVLCKKRGLKNNGSKNILIDRILNDMPGSKFEIKRFSDLCNIGLRPHICFDKINEQLSEHIKIVWNGNINIL